MDKIPSIIWNLLSGFPVSPDSKSDAERWLSAGELWLVVFAILVGVGLIGEHKAETAEKKWLPESERSGWKWVAIWTWVVIVSILGELFCDADIWVSSDVLQAISDKQLEDTKKAAADANERTAKAELELAKIKAPRRLTPVQSNELIAKLRLYEAKTFWLLTERTDDDDRSEQMLLSRQLLNAFSQAGWTKTSHVMTVGQKEPQEFSPVSDRGISVQFASDPKSRELGDRMAKDLNAIGLDCEKNEDSTQSPNTIVIEIGLR